MGAYTSRANQTSWSVNVTLDRTDSVITYTLSSTSNSLVKVIKGSDGRSITMCVDPTTAIMTFEGRQSGKDGDLGELTTLLKDDLIPSIAKRWNLVVEEDSESESEAESEHESSSEEDEEEEVEEKKTEVVETTLDLDASTETLADTHVTDSELGTEEEENSGTDGWDSE